MARSRDARRWEDLHRLEDWLEVPMVVLGFVWLVLLVVELTAGLTPWMEVLGTVIWVVFLVDFLLRLALAPARTAYLRTNWLTALALVLPALRVLRAFRAIRALRALRGVRLVRLLTSVNRGMRALGKAMRERAVGYVFALSALVCTAGAAGILAFERDVAGSGIRSFPEALWWTAMLLTTIGPGYWPTTVEGRILTLLLSGYALGVLGYITAALASLFIGRDVRASGEAERKLDLVRAELAALRTQMATERNGSVQDPDRLSD